MASAFIYPGQGSQSVGMGQRLALSSAAAAAVWERADATLDEPISRLAWQGPAEELDLTVNAQPALLVASVAAGAALEAAVADAAAPLVGPPSYHAGHSMGQYSAMVAAGVLELEDAVRLVRERGRLMQASSGDGAMAAIIGLDDARIDELIASGTDAGVLTVANRNSPGQIVVSGERAAVDAAAAAARGLGARRAILLPVSVAAHSPLIDDAADGMRAAVDAAAAAARGLGARRAIVLPVSVAAHSPLMDDAADGMRAALAGVSFADPDAPLLANADATPLTSGESCRDELIEHLTRGVDWVAAVEKMTAAGVDTFVEVGPGKVLSGLVRRIAPGATTIALDDITTDDGLELPAAEQGQE